MTPAKSAPVSQSGAPEAAQRHYERGVRAATALERPLALDSPGQMVASILSKKIAAGATHLVLDIPIGPTAKVREPLRLDLLAREAGADREGHDAAGDRANLLLPRPGRLGELHARVHVFELLVCRGQGES